MGNIQTPTPALSNALPSSVNAKFSEIARDTLRHRMTQLHSGWWNQNQDDMLKITPIDRLPDVKPVTEDTTALYVTSFRSLKFIRDAFTVAGWEVTYHNEPGAVVEGYTFTSGLSKVHLSGSEMASFLVMFNSNEDKIESVPYKTKKNRSVLFTTLFVEHITGWDSIANGTSLEYIIIQPIISQLRKALS